MPLDQDMDQVYSRAPEASMAHNKYVRCQVNDKSTNKNYKLAIVEHLQKEESLPDVLLQRLKKLVNMLDAIGAQVRHQQVSIVERHQVVVDVLNREFAHVMPTATDITA